MISSIKSTIVSIDHVGLVGIDIRAMTETFESLGFTLTAASP